MRKVVKCIGIVLLLSLALTGCHQSENSMEKYTTVEEYETKTIQSMRDQDVKIEHYMTEGKGAIKVQFSEKEIPIEIPLISKDQTYQGGLNISGSLGEGQIKIMALSGPNDVMWEKTFSSGKLKAKPRFDMYSGTYTLRLEFYKAKKGNFKIEFLTEQI